MNTLLQTKRITKWVDGGSGRIFLLRDVNLTKAIATLWGSRCIRSKKGK